MSQYKCIPDDSKFTIPIQIHADYLPFLVAAAKQQNLSLNQLLGEIMESALHDTVSNYKKDGYKND